MSAWDAISDQELKCCIASNVAFLNEEKEFLRSENDRLIYREIVVARWMEVFIGQRMTEAKSKKESVE